MGDEWFNDIFKTKKLDPKMDKLRAKIKNDKTLFDKDMEKLRNKIGKTKSSMTGPLPNSPDWGVVIGGSSAETWRSDIKAEEGQFGKLTVDGMDVGKTLKTLQDRFLILEDDFKKHEQYPALKAAYEQYKLIEALLKEE